MRRAPELKPLSEEHHLALVLARAAKRASGGDLEAVIEAWGYVTDRFEKEMAPHFAIEEETLAPALQHAGEGELVERLLDDHRRLRELALESQRDAVTLRMFGDLLETHVRFEERDLFERAQQVLDAKSLANVFNAHRERHPVHPHTSPLPSPEGGQK